MAVSSSPRSSRKKQAPRRASTSRRRSCSAPSGGSAGAGTGRSSGACVPQEQHDLAVVAPEGPGADPHHLAGGGQLVEQPGRVVGDPGRQHVALEHRAGMGTPCSWRDHLEQPVEATAPVGADALPAGQEPGQRLGVGRLDLPRSAASDRWRSRRSTSGSHHSRSLPPGRNSPRSSRPCVGAARQQGVDDAAPGARSARRLGGRERPVGAGPAAEQRCRAGRRPARGTRRAGRAAAGTPRASR